MKYDYLGFFKKQLSFTAIVFILLLTQLVSINVAYGQNVDNVTLTPYVDVTKVLIIDIKESLFGNIGLIQNQAAVITSSPTSNTVAVGSTFTVSVLLNTTGANADGVDIKYLKFNPALLSVQQITPGTLFPSTQTNTFDNTAGTVSFSQITTGGSTFNGSGTLATITFLAKSAGTATLTFDFTLNNTTDTNVASAGTDTLTEATGATYTLSSIVAPPSTKFAINDRVQTTSVLNVRSTANGALLGTQSINSKGTIIGGPTVAGGFTWWNINYDNAPDGWSVEDYLINAPIQVADTTPPSTPTGLTATPISSSQINLSWTASTDNIAVTGYKIYRGGTEITTVTGTSYQNTSLSPLTSYTYTVSAYDVAGNNSSQSISSSATTKEVAVQTCTSFTYSSWGACQSDNTQTRSVTSSSPSGCTGGAPVLTQSCVYVPPTITCASFTYSTWGACQSDNTQTRSVTSSSPSGCTGGTPSLTQACTFTPIDVLPPAISNIQSINITPTTANITWTTNEASNSQIEYGLSTTYSAGATNLNQTMTTSHSEILSGLSSNTTYHFRVKSTDASSNSAVSTDKTFTTTGLPDTIAPSSITNLSTSFINHTSITLNWSAPGDDGSVGTSASYDIRYSTSTITEATWNTATTLTGEPTPKVSGSNQSYTVAGLSPSTTYYFAMKSKDENNNTSGLSNIVSNKTQDVTTNPILGCTKSSATNYNKNATEDDGTCTYPQTSAPSVSTGGGGGGGSSSGGGGGGGSFYDSVAPGQPKDFVAQGADKQILLSWKNPTDSDFVRVILFRSTQKISDNIVISSIQDIADIAYEGKAEEYSDTDLINDVEYYYAIYAHDKRPNYSKPLILKVKTEAGKTTITKIKDTEVQAQTQKSAQTPSTSSGSSISSSKQAQYIKTNLFVGQNNDQTKLLQQLLAKDRDVYPEGITSGFYGQLTQRAVERFQIKHNIVKEGTPSTTGFGIVGPKTLAKINEVFVDAQSSSVATEQVQEIATPVQATSNIQTKSNLTQNQIDSILNLLASFNAEQSVIDNVRVSLGNVGAPTQTDTTFSAPTDQVIKVITDKIVGPFSIGMTSDQVKLLQEILSQDKEIYPDAITSGYYGSLTQMAVERFQCRYMEICSGSPDVNGYGLAGPSTREKINEIFSSQ